MAEREQPEWFRAAEELVRRLRRILEYGDELEAALATQIGREEAQAELEKIDLLVRVLEVELWRTAKPSKEGVGKLTAVVLLICGTMLTRGVEQVTTDLYEAIRDVEQQAQQVENCIVIDPDALVVAEGADQGSTPSATKYATEAQMRRQGRPQVPTKATVDRPGTGFNDPFEQRPRRQGGGFTLDTDELDGDQGLS